MPGAASARRYVVVLAGELPQCCLDRLTTTMELATARSVLRQLTALANSTATLSDAERTNG